MLPQMSLRFKIRAAQRRCMGDGDPMLLDEVPTSVAKNVSRCGSFALNGPCVFWGGGWGAVSHAPACCRANFALSGRRAAQAAAPPTR